MLSSSAATPLHGAPVAPAPPVPDGPLGLRRVTVLVGSQCLWKAPGPVAGVSASWRQEDRLANANCGSFCNHKSPSTGRSLLLLPVISGELLLLLMHPKSPQALAKVLVVWARDQQHHQKW